jgi:hypothetical protein
MSISSSPPVFVCFRGPNDNFRPPCIPGNIPEGEKRSPARSDDWTFDKAEVRQPMSIRRKASIFSVLAATAVLATAAIGFACTNLATLNLSSAAGKPGDVVTVTGSSFAVNSRDVAASFPVVLRWNGVDGKELATVQPDKAGNISATFTVPDGQPGYYVIVGTQKDARGVDTYGTPARASYQILGPNGQSVVEPAPATTGAPVAESSSTGIIALTVGLGVLGLGLFGAGFAAFVRQARRAPAGAAVRQS